MTTEASDLIPTADLPRALRENAIALGLDPARLDRVSYRVTYSAVVDGRVPAERQGGRWFVRRAHLATLAQALGIPCNAVVAA